METLNVINSAKDKMSKSLDNLKSSLSKLRTGRATPSLLDSVKVENYGVISPINQVANISIPEPRTILIQPWDVNSIKAIEKAIIKEDLGLNPQSDGKLIRLAIPELTEERRQGIIKMVKKMGEDTKVSIRQTRKSSNDSLKKLEKDKVISEDDNKKGQVEIQTLTDENVASTDEIVKNKSTEIESV